MWSLANRRIVVPVLCAAVLTLFSLRYYNHRRLEKLSIRSTHVRPRTYPPPGETDPPSRRSPASPGRSWGTRGGLLVGGDKRGLRRKDFQQGAPFWQRARLIRSGPLAMDGTPFEDPPWPSTGSPKGNSGLVRPGRQSWAFSTIGRDARVRTPQDGTPFEDPPWPSTGSPKGNSGLVRPGRHSWAFSTIGRDAGVRTPQDGAPFEDPPLPSTGSPKGNSLLEKPGPQSKAFAAISDNAGSNAGVRTPQGQPLVKFHARQPSNQRSLVDNSVRRERTYNVMRTKDRHENISRIERQLELNTEHWASERLKETKKFIGKANQYLTPLDGKQQFQDSSSHKSNIASPLNTTGSVTVANQTVQNTISTGTLTHRRTTRSTTIGVGHQTGQQFPKPTVSTKQEVPKHVSIDQLIPQHAVNVEQVPKHPVTRDQEVPRHNVTGDQEVPRLNVTRDQQILKHTVTRDQQVSKHAVTTDQQVLKHSVTRDQQGPKHFVTTDQKIPKDAVNRNQPVVSNPVNTTDYGLVSGTKGKRTLQQIFDDSISPQILSDNRNKAIDTALRYKANASLRQEGKSYNLWGEELGPATTSVSLSNRATPRGTMAEVMLSADQLPPKAMRSRYLGFSYRPVSNRRYVVMAVSCIGDDYNYVFSLPFAVRAWWRIGYSSIVLIAGAEKHWMEKPILNYVLTELKRTEEEPVVLFMEAPETYWRMLSQVSRLFVGGLFDWRGMEDTRVVISDVDIWPLTKEMYDLPVDKDLLVLNAGCCGSFEHRGGRYQMLPMCNLVASAATWKEVISPAVQTTLQMIDYFRAEFGIVVDQQVTKGENQGWFLDQQMATVRVAQWAHQHGQERILYSHRDVGRDRVDRSYWFPYGITRKNDIHMLEHFYQPGAWERALPLLRQMFSEQLNAQMEQYRAGFIRMLLHYKMSNSQ